MLGAKQGVASELRLKAHPYPASASHDEGDVFPPHEAAVVCETSQHVSARLGEGHRITPLPAFRDRRRRPAGGPRRVPALPIVLPHFELWRGERAPPFPAGHRPRTPE